MIVQPSETSISPNETPTTGTSTNTKARSRKVDEVIPFNAQVKREKRDVGQLMSIVCKI